VTGVARRSRPSPPALAAWRGFLRLHVALLERFDDDLVARHDLPLAWYDVLVQLNDADGSLTMGSLSSRLLISPATCTRVVERMVRAGLVERTVDPADGRVRHVSPTTAGRRMLTSAAGTHLRGIERHFGRFLDDAEATELAARFARMLESLDRP
jgi:DNA-binding MarR family transcriptional regulator